MHFLIILLLSVEAALAGGDTVLQELINANNLFTSSFYQQVVQNNEPNFLTSPYSALACLAFLQSGCKGETAEEIRNVLHLSADNNRVGSAVKESISILKGNENYILYTANKLYTRVNFNLKQEFEKSAVEVYRAEVESINFDAKEQAAKTINEWVERQTNNKIQSLYSPSAITNDLMAIIINAIYFKGNWSYQFDENLTQKKDFYKTNNEVLQVDTMQLSTQWLNYFENRELNAKFLELPYKGGAVSMVIVLPNKREGLSEIENQSEKVFAPQEFRKEIVNVRLPKFKIETRIPLVGMLQKIGINKVFDPHQADLSGIAGEKGDLYVGDALQKTYIEVTEEGVEAAAVTVTDIMLISDPPQIIKIEPLEFIVDHPFIFYIKAGDFVIFAGKVSAPQP